MPIKYTQATLDKIIKVLDESGYILRFEKGTFNSGYCILEHKKVVVVNKFLNLEGRINTLTDILALIRVDENTLSIESKKTYTEVLKEVSGRTVSQEHTENGSQENDQKIP